jgi:hypothetical protein
LLDEIIFARENFGGFTPSRGVRETTFAHVNVAGRGANLGRRRAGQDADRKRAQQGFSRFFVADYEMDHSVWRGDEETIEIFP